MSAPLRFLDRLLRRLLRIQSPSEQWRDVSHAAIAAHVAARAQDEGVA